MKDWIPFRCNSDTEADISDCLDVSHIIQPCRSPARFISSSALSPMHQQLLPIAFPNPENKLALNPFNPLSHDYGTNSMQNLRYCTALDFLKRASENIPLQFCLICPNMNGQRTVCSGKSVNKYINLKKKTIIIIRWSYLGSTTKLVPVHSEWNHCSVITFKCHQSTQSEAWMTHRLSFQFLSKLEEYSLVCNSVKTV